MGPLGGGNGGERCRPVEQFDRSKRRTNQAELASYLLVALAVPLTLGFHLLGTVFDALTVHVLTIKLARRLPLHWGGLAHKFALASLVIFVVLALLGAGLGLWSFLHGSRGMAALLSASAQTLENLRRTLPPAIAEVMPPSPDSSLQPKDGPENVVERKQSIRNFDGPPIRGIEACVPENLPLVRHSRRQL